MRILLVEDEAKVASFVKRGLEQAQHVVEIAPDQGRRLPGVNSGLRLVDSHLPVA